jgi:hypothetical protein
LIHELRHNVDLVDDKPINNALSILDYLEKIFRHWCGDK